MKKFLFIAFLFFTATYIGIAQYQGKISKEEFEAVLNKQEDKLQVINFWASWCGPCGSKLCRGN